MVIHVGGAYGDTRSGIDRWCTTWDQLPERVRARLVLEHDDLRFSAADVLAIHQRTGVRLIFDVQHFCCLNPEQLPMKETLKQFLRSWPSGVRPKIHFSSPRTEMREIARTDRKTGKKKLVLQPPIWTGHAAYNHPFEFISFMRSMSDLEFDVMLEAKAKDLALLRLQQDLLRYASDVAGRFGLTSGNVTVEEREEIILDAAALEAAV
jgi:UV DNA damage endonuclease